MIIPHAVQCAAGCYSMLFQRLQPSRFLFGGGAGFQDIHANVAYYPCSVWREIEIDSVILDEINLFVENRHLYLSIVVANIFTERIGCIPIVIQ